MGIIPALAQLNLEEDNSPPLILSPSHLLAWTFAVAFFGVFLAVPLRKQVIVKEQLVFPSGTATAQLISVLHAVPPPGMKNRSSRNGRSRGDYQMIDDAVRNDDEEVEEVLIEEKKIDQDGWNSLIWSFTVSASYTVSVPVCRILDLVLMVSQIQLLSLAFPVVNAIPIFDVFGSLAHDYLWWLVKSLDVQIFL